ncbi:MAG: hypothetical protein WC668_03935 [Patescibacteria group bacterium]|jgi:hypothetical protein
MIKSPTKKKLLAELEKNGNVTIACLKSGVNRATFYRWKQESNEFKERAEQAELSGRENNCDIAEQSLMLKIKDKDLGAIKYLLSHNSPRYKGKETSMAVIIHKKEMPESEFISIEQPEVYNRVCHEYAIELQEKYKYLGEKLPNKPNGLPIELDELPLYETYIEDWKEERRKERVAAGLEHERQVMPWIAQKED